MCVDESEGKQHFRPRSPILWRICWALAAHRHWLGPLSSAPRCEGRPPALPARAGRPALCGGKTNRKGGSKLPAARPKARCNFLNPASTSAAISKVKPRARGRLLSKHPGLRTGGGRRRRSSNFRSISGSRLSRRRSLTHGHI